MYQMTPIYFKPDGHIARHTDIVVKAALAVLAAFAILALALTVLAAAHIAWLHLLNWIDAQSSPVIFRQIMGGF